MHLVICLIAIILIFVPFPIHAQQNASLSAWDTLVRENPPLTESASDLEREILQLMTRSQVQDYLNGMKAAEIVLVSGETLAAFLERKGVSSFDVSWYSIDGGGRTISGGDFTLVGSIGQPDAGAMTGGDFALTGGFFSIASAQQPGIPCDVADRIFCDDFESGDLTEWSNSVLSN